LIRLAREAGVGSRLEPVLSFPLGSNVISLLESTRIYETLVTGRRWSAQLADHAAAGETDEERRRLNGLALIERVERPDGTVLYARQAAATPVLDQKSSSEIASILENVVRWGTGRHAWEQVRLPGLSQEKSKGPALPVMGKTGTANDFRNAAFIGFVPSAPDIDGAALLSSAGAAIGVYVGFDSNEPMKHGSFRVSGSQGALPTWSRIANALLKLEGTADRLAPEAVAADRIRLRYPESGQLFMPVDEKNGGRMRRGADGVKNDLPPDEAAVLCHGLPGEYGGFEPTRRFLPFWLNQSGKAEPSPAPEPAVEE
jgi:penicillin-binding protein 1A